MPATYFNPRLQKINKVSSVRVTVICIAHKHNSRGQRRDSYKGVDHTLTSEESIHFIKKKCPNEKSLIMDIFIRPLPEDYQKEVEDRMGP